MKEQIQGWRIEEHMPADIYSFYRVYGGYQSWPLLCFNHQNLQGNSLASVNTEIPRVHQTSLSALVSAKAIFFCNMYLCLTAFLPFLSLQDDGLGDSVSVTIVVDLESSFSPASSGTIPMAFAAREARFCSFRACRSNFLCTFAARLWIFACHLA